MRIECFLSEYGEDGVFVCSVCWLIVWICDGDLALIF